MSRTAAVAALAVAGSLLATAPARAQKVPGCTAQLTAAPSGTRTSCTYDSSTSLSIVVATGSLEWALGCGGYIAYVGEVAPRVRNFSLDGCLHATVYLVATSDGTTGTGALY